MRGIAGNHQHKGFDCRHAVFPRKGLQLHLGIFMQAHTVFQLDFLNFLGRVIFRIKIALRYHRRHFHKAVFHRPRQRVIHHHVFKRNRRFGGFHKRRGSQLQTQQRIQFINRPHPRLRPITVRFVHQQHQIGQVSQIIEITVAQHLAHPLDTRLLAAAHFGIDFGNIENIDAHLGKEIRHADALLLIVIAGNHARRVHGKFANALEHIFRRIGRKIANQLVVNGQVRRQHKKVVDAVRQVQIGDKRPHQTGFAHPRCQGKT